MEEEQNLDENNSNLCSYRSFPDNEFSQNENLSFLCFENDDDKFSFCESHCFHETRLKRIEEASFIEGRLRI